MAPNKKKKRPAGNPARGFATVSTASKTKEQASNEVQQDEKWGVPGQDAKLLSEGSNVSINGVSDIKPEKTLQELSPEELEMQLENSSLQLLIDTYREKTKKDASKQVSRLQTERRVLRSQADHLNTRRWLPAEVMQLITDLIEMQVKSSNERLTGFDTIGSTLDHSRDDVLVKIWTLKRLLLQLGFSEHSTRLALRHLLIKITVPGLNSFSSSTDPVWGLDECLDWLALTSKPDDLPLFELQEAVKGSQRATDHIRSGASAKEDKTFNTSNNPTPSTPLSKGTPGRQSPLNEGSPASSESDSASDLESDQQITRYLALQTRLYEINPDLVEPIGRKKHAAAKNSDMKATPRSETDRKIARLTAKLHKITSDILFDEEAASSKWAETWICLVKEAVERKRLGIRNGNEQEHRRPENSSPQNAAVTESTDNTEDTSDMLGELFSSLPESTTDPTTGTSNMKTTNSAGTTVMIRSFGKWAGISPRRVFEEACRSRDPSCLVTYKLISATTFSYRHCLETRWSRAQQSIASTPKALDSITCETGPYSTKIEMISIACPDATQSEAYISTVALFLVLASSPKEEKAYLRLPSVWRDLWTELSAIKKEQNDAQDREVLRELSSMVDECRSQTEDLSLITNVEPSKQRKSDSEVPGAATPPPIASPEELRAIWEAKVSTTSYKDMLASRMNLPIWNFKCEILKAIVEHQIIIVCGETGCGKSTQVPSFILEHQLSSGRSCKVYCTEPRRISAISLARRVSEELGERKHDVGTSRSLVGYAIRLESQITTQTRLVYATTGIVMRMLERSDDLPDITHLVIDEVHERSIDSDFLLIVLRKLLVKRPDLKVVLMSATVDAQKFSKYLDDAPIMNVPGRTFPVDTRYLEDAIELTHFNTNARYRDAGETEDDEDDVLVDASAKTSLSADNLKYYSADTCNALLKFDEYRLNYDLMLRLLEKIATFDDYASYSKAILVFLPGIAEIKRLNDMLVGHAIFTNRWYIYALHSTITTEEQERAFLIPHPGYRKIILATNIAETGITIPDVTCVIDTGKHKEMRFDERRQLSRLIEVFISRANAKQRRGRAGRVQNGLCFHLFTKHRHDNIILEEQTPEMLRLSLQDLVLRVRICKLGGIEQTLSEALDPPSAKNIRRAIDALVDVRALTSMEELTPLGRQLAKLPLDVFLGKLILLGCIFGCLDAMLTVAAILSSKSPFAAPMGARSQVDAARLAFKKGDSDLITVYNAYRAWRRLCSANGMSEHQFCRKNFLSQQTLSNIEDLKAQLTASLADAGFVKLNDSEKAALNKVRFHSRKRNFVEIPGHYNTNNNNDLILNTTIACSFYPKLLKREGKGWRNIANNQVVSLHPTSVNKGAANPPQWLSFYHIMQSSNKFYNAHETSAVDDAAVALICGEVEFKMYAGVMVIDGNRIRFSVNDWKTMLAIRTLRTQVKQIMAQSFRHPGRSLSPHQQAWLEIWQRIFSCNSSD